MPEGEPTPPDDRPLYHRVLLKLSGDVRARGHGVRDLDRLDGAAGSKLADVVDLGVQTAVVVGGGSIFRGRQAPGIDRSRADYMGMLATVMNALALQDALEKIHVPNRVQTSIHMAQIAEPYIPLRAKRHLEKGASLSSPPGSARRTSPPTPRPRSGARDRRAGDPEGHEGRRVYRGPARRSERAPVRVDRVPRRAARGLLGDGRDGDQPVHGERAPDHRVRLPRGGTSAARSRASGSAPMHGGVR